MPYSTRWITAAALTEHLPCARYLFSTLTCILTEVFLDSGKLRTQLDMGRTSASSTWSEGQKTSGGQGEGQSGFGSFIVSGSLPLSGPFPSPSYVLKWCLFASVPKFTLAYHLPSVKNQTLVLSPGEGVPKPTFVFLFFCRMFNHEPNCMVYQNELPSE